MNNISKKNFSTLALVPFVKSGLNLINEYKIGAQLCSMGKYSQGLEMYKRSAEIYEHANQKKTLEFFLSNMKIAKCFLELSQLDKCEKKLKELNNLSLTIPNNTKEVHEFSLGNLLSFYTYFDINKAETLINQIKFDLLSLSNRQKFYIHSSVIKYCQKKKEESLNILSKVDSKDEIIKGAILHNQGIITNNPKKIEEAIACFSKADNQNKKIRLKQQALSLVELCEKLKEANEPKDKINYWFKETLNFFSKNSSEPYLTIFINKYLALLADRYENLGQTLIAEGLYQRSNDYSHLMNKFRTPLEKTVKKFTQTEYGNFLLSQQKRSFEGKKILSLSSKDKIPQWYNDLCKFNYINLNI